MLSALRILALAACLASSSGTSSPAYRAWSSGQLHEGERRESLLSSGVSTEQSGRVHIGTHEFYTDKNGVRKIDKVLSHYVQGICTDFLSTTRQACLKHGGQWYDCPESFPHADSLIRNKRSHIPMCYTEIEYAEAGRGPPGSWCVPSHLIAIGPKVAEQINLGRGQVCDTTFRRVARKEQDSAEKWKRRAHQTGEALQDDESKLLKYRREAKRRRREENDLEEQLQDEQKKERRWKRLANNYKTQVEQDRASAQTAVDQLQDALNDMDKTGKKRGQALRSSSSASSSASRDDKPLARNARSEICERPWIHAADSSHCTIGPCSKGACEYLRRHCKTSSGLFNYLSLPYCSMGFSPMLALIILVFWSCLICIWMVCAAEVYLSPSLIVVSRLLNMSENVAGVTLLAMGNGAAQMATLIASVLASTRGTQIGLGSLVGRSLFVSCVVLGLIAIYTPLHRLSNEMMRDVSFLFISFFWLFVSLFDSHISMIESIGFVVLYMVYFYLVMDSYWSNYFKWSKNTREDKQSDTYNDTMDLVRFSAGGSWQPPVGEPGGRETTLQASLMEYLNPFSDETMKGGNTYEKILMGLRAPGLFALRLTVPYVNEGRQDLGWNKQATLVQLVFGPLVLVWCFLLHRFPGTSLAGVYISFAVSLVMGMMCAGIVHVTSRNNQPPEYQRYLAVIAFVIGMAWVYIFAVEFVHVLQAIGRVLGLSDSYIGLTVLGGANSISDLFANLAVARGGMPAMAAAACIGGPLIDILMGAGLATLLGNFLVVSPFPLDMNLQLYTSLCFLLFALFAILVFLQFHGMQAGKNFGYMLVTIYVAFFFTVLGLEIWGGNSLLHSTLP